MNRIKKALLVPIAWVLFTMLIGPAVVAIMEADKDMREEEQVI